MICESCCKPLDEKHSWTLGPEVHVRVLDGMGGDFIDSGHALCIGVYLALEFGVLEVACA